MNITIVTPLGADSAIATSTALVVNELIARGHQVVAVGAESPDHPQQISASWQCKVLPAWWDLTALRLLERSDVVVYEIGDNFTLHQGALELLQHVPGIVVLHDFFLGNLFNGWARTRRDAAQQLLEYWYGLEAASGFFEHSSMESFLANAPSMSPLTEWVASKATGILTHSGWGLDRVRKASIGPSLVAMLPYSSAAVRLGLSRDGEAPAQTQRRQRKRILTFGRVNSNKRVADVIDAIASSEVLRRSTLYQVVGAIEPLDTLDLSRRARLAGVRFLVSGAVSDEVLDAALKSADIVSCLRWPCLEAGSASVAEALLYGRATIVTDVGPYAELPEDCVMKVPGGESLAPLTQALEFLVTDDESRSALGRRASEFAQGAFSASVYVDTMLRLADEAQGKGAVVRAVGFFEHQLSTWSGNRGQLATAMGYGSLEVADDGGEELAHA